MRKMNPTDEEEIPVSTAATTVNTECSNRSKKEKKKSVRDEQYVLTKPLSTVYVASANVRLQNLSKNTSTFFHS